METFFKKNERRTQNRFSKAVSYNFSPPAVKVIPPLWYLSCGNKYLSPKYLKKTMKLKTVVNVFIFDY